MPEPVPVAPATAGGGAADRKHPSENDNIENPRARHPDRGSRARRHRRGGDAPEAVDNANARELCELFFAAGSAERRLILLNLEYADWPAGEPPAPLQRADIWRLESAALRHHTASR